MDASGPPPSERRQSVFLLRRRMNITAANKTTITPQIKRIVVVSIDKLSFLLLIGQCQATYMFSIMGIRSRTRCVITGPIVTTNSDGSTQKKIGKTSFTASFDAFSSAFCRAIVRR